MTRVQQKYAVLFAAIVLALGCIAVVAVAPQTAHATETKLTAGTTFTAARDISAKGGGSIAKKAMTMKVDGVRTTWAKKGEMIITTRNLATFNSDNDNHYYRFTTSNRNSLYRITVEKEVNDGRQMTVEIRDAKLRKFSDGLVKESEKTYSVLFNAANGEIMRNETYFIELSRFIPRSTTEGSSERSPYVDYRISVQEIVPKPKAIKADDFSYRLYTKSKKLEYVINRRSFDADGYEVQQYTPRLRKWISYKFSGTTYTARSAQVTQAIDAGYRNYYTKIRPYRKIGSSFVYGNWTNYYSEFQDRGTYVKCIKNYDGFRAGKYYSAKKVQTDIPKAKIRRAKFECNNQKKLVKYVRAKKITVVNK